MESGRKLPLSDYTLRYFDQLSMLFNLKIDVQIYLLKIRKTGNIYEVLKE